jgi:hypothetical protein
MDFNDRVYKAVLTKETVDPDAITFSVEEEELEKDLNPTDGSIDVIAEPQPNGQTIQELEEKLKRLKG